MPKGTFWVDDFPYPSWGICQAGGAEEDGHDDGMVPKHSNGWKWRNGRKKQSRGGIGLNTVFCCFIFVCSLGTLFYRWYTVTMVSLWLSNNHLDLSTNSVSILLRSTHMHVFIIVFFDKRHCVKWHWNHVLSADNTFAHCLCCFLGGPGIHSWPFLSIWLCEDLSRSFVFVCFRPSFATT